MEIQNRFKFRVWEKDQKIMKEVTQITLDKDQTGSMCNIKGKVTAHLIYQPHYILMQCTGVKDKNGKLIYEGDILKEIYDTGEKERGVDFTQVKWDENSAGFVLFRPEIPKDITYFDDIDDMNNFEIVGNIYENPEPQIIKAECEKV